MGEFELIARYFARPAQRRLTGMESAGVVLGIGDDCALLETHSALAVSTDMLVEGRHFFADVDPNALGHKCLAVNLSDLAAMGAKPFAYTLALSLPEVRARDDVWMNAFAQGMHALADAHGCILVGGDTTGGPLTICITVMGQVDSARALRRGAALPADDIYVSGSLGDAAFALAQLRVGASVERSTRDRLERPEPRVKLGQALAGIAHAGIDISDGLAGDLGHVLAASGAGARVELGALPFSRALRELPRVQSLRFAVAGGDDYELCFTAAPEDAGAIQAAAAFAGVPITRIGTITSRASRAELEDVSGVNTDAAAIVWTENGVAVPFAPRAFDHFA